MRRIFIGSLLALGIFSVHAFAEEPPSGAEESRRARVFATIGDKEITVGELEDIINARSPYARKRFEDPKIIKEFADEQVKSEIFAQGAKRLGYADDPDVRKFLDQTIIQRFVRIEFEEAVTPDSVPDDEIAKYYNEHPDEFRRPEMRRASHILLASREEAREIVKELESEEGTTFRALAKQRSLDTETKLRRGDLLYFTADGSTVGGKEDAAIDSALAKAAFKLEKVGDLTEKPVALGDEKWSVLKLTGIRPAKVHSLEDASGAIRRRLWREERKAALDKLITDLRAELKPEVHPERMDAIVLPPPAEPIEALNQ